jgi:hypothetical protein
LTLPGSDSSQPEADSNDKVVDESNDDEENDDSARDVVLTPKDRLSGTKRLLSEAKSFDLTWPKRIKPL